MDTEIFVYIEHGVLTAFGSLGNSLAQLGLSSKMAYRGSKAYTRYISHGIRDPLFIINASSSICAGASLLTLGSSKVLLLTPLASFSPTLFTISSSLGVMSDGLDESFKWHSPIL